MNPVSAVRKAFDRFTGGKGEFSITVPVMDGPLKPNDYLERASSIGAIDAADNLVAIGDKLLLTSHNRIMQLSLDGEFCVHSEYEAEISCLTVSNGGAIAIGVDGLGVMILGGAHDGKLLDKLAMGPLKCPTAALFLDENTLIVSNGSAEFPAAKWNHDLIHHGSSGTVARIDLASKRAADLATGLRFPAGLSFRPGNDEEVVASEAWKHRLIVLATDRPSAPREVLGGLPAYPGRICRSKAGGYWVALFSVRSQLQEFVLREDRFRKQMIAEIDPEFWIVPALASGRSFKEPLQAGGVIRLGVHKPWAPTRSYGLVLRLDADFQPLWSAHSRADGSRHGITSFVEMDGGLVMTSKGKGEVILLIHTAQSEPLDLIFPADDAA